MKKNKKTDRGSKARLGPGSLVHIGQRDEGEVKIRVMDYSAGHLKEFQLNDMDTVSQYFHPESVTWFDIDGIHNPEIVSHIGKVFGIHVLALEDIMNSASRPKVESFDNYTLITLKMIDYRENGEIRVEQLSIVYGEGYLISFQEVPGDSFDPVRERIRASLGRVRSRDAEYLAYLLMDNIVDNYILVSQQYAGQIESLENLIVSHPREATLHRILALRKELLNFKQNVDPLREAINTLYRQCKPDNQKYFRDVFDHILYESENLAMYRELIVNLLELHQNMLSMKTNAVMKVLTIITTIFVPLTFIAGVYGMNFENMPELGWEHGYYYVLLLMLLCVTGMFIYFRRQKWL